MGVGFLSVRSAQESAPEGAGDGTDVRREGAALGSRRLAARHCGMTASAPPHAQKVDGSLNQRPPIR